VRDRDGDQLLGPRREGALVEHGLAEGSKGGRWAGRETLALLGQLARDLRMNLIPSSH
jgi:hypothetical protein